MIPEYLKGKSAAVICNEMKTRFYTLSESISKEDYILLLEGFLIQAVTHALCNADPSKNWSEVDRAQEAQGRAIAFLNIVLPYEEKNGN